MSNIPTSSARSGELLPPVDGRQEPLDSRHVVAEQKVHGIQTSLHDAPGIKNAIDHGAPELHDQKPRVVEWVSATHTHAETKPARGMQRIRPLESFPHANRKGAIPNPRLIAGAVLDAATYSAQQGVRHPKIAGITEGVVGTTAANLVGRVGYAVVNAIPSLPPNLITNVVGPVFGPAIAPAMMKAGQETEAHRNGRDQIAAFARRITPAGSGDHFEFGLENDLDLLCNTSALPKTATDIKKNTEILRQLMSRDPAGQLQPKNVPLLKTDEEYIRYCFEVLHDLLESLSREPVSRQIKLEQEIIKECWIFVAPAAGIPATPAADLAEKKKNLRSLALESARAIQYEHEQRSSNALSSSVRTSALTSLGISSVLGGSADIVRLGVLASPVVIIDVARRLSAIFKKEPNILFEKEAMVTGGAAKAPVTAGGGKELRSFVVETVVKPGLVVGTGYAILNQFGGATAVEGVSLVFSQTTVVIAALTWGLLMNYLPKKLH